MKFSSIALTLLALPAALVQAASNEPRTSHEFEKRQLESRTFIQHGCDLVTVANCFIKGQNIDSGCRCVSPPIFQRPAPPYGSWTACNKPERLALCWSRGQGCDIIGNCIGPRQEPPPPPTPAPGTCNNILARSICAMNGKDVDGKCCCVSRPPTVPGGGTQCGDPNKVQNCFRQGWGCNSQCVCVPPSTPTTPPPHPTTPPPPPPTKPPAPGICLNWIKVAECVLQHKKTDGNCNCIGEPPSVPGGNTDCKDPNALARCWKLGWGCNSRCVCVPPPTSVPPPSTVPPPSSTPTSVGQCKDIIKIKWCALTGRGVDEHCECVRCSCIAQWDCIWNGGRYDHNTCQCVRPSGGHGWKKRENKNYRAACPAGLTACKIGRNSAQSWTGQFECLDTANQIDSCGGCSSEGTGQDCATIEGVAQVDCVEGRCAVSACAEGYRVAGNGTTCESEIAPLKQLVMGL